MAATMLAGGSLAPTSLLAQLREKARPFNLRVTGLSTFVVDAGNDENFVFVKIRTNQGLTGLGEGTFTGKEATVEKAIQEHERYLVGKDPTDIGFHYQGMFRGPRYRGGALMMSALSAVEIALWDILGQALGQPIWKLLGGKTRDRIRIYPHAGGQTPAQAAASFAERKKQGWTAAKGGFVQPEDNVIDPSESVGRGLERLQAVREVVGPKFDILIDLHGKCTTPMAVEFCRGAERFRPMFIEEPTQLEDIGELAHLRAKTSAPLATGERHVTKYAFAEICARHLVDYVQPDIVHCGGILEMVQIASLADTFRIQLAPHNPQSEVSTVASMHVMAAVPNAPILEIGSAQQNPKWKDLFFGGLVTFRDGYAALPDRPGLGLDLDEKVAARFPYRPKDWRSHRFPDGSIADR
jgi:galactonate dehydratase